MTRESVLCRLSADAAARLEPLKRVALAEEAESLLAQTVVRVELAVTQPRIRGGIPCTPLSHRVRAPPPPSRILPLTIGRPESRHMREPRWAYFRATPSKSVHACGCGYGGFSEASPTLVDRLEVPVASTVLILCCGAPVSLRPALRSGSSSRLFAFSAGPQVQAQRVMHAGINECVEIRMPPLAAYTLFGGVVAERNCSPVDLLEIGHRPTTVLLDQLQNTKSWGDRFRAVDQWLQLGLMASEYRIPPRVIWAWEILQSCHGQVSVRELALHAGCSERHLANQFFAYFGVRPKDIARRLRFSHAFDSLTSREAVDLCAIAAQSGFSDQSHMTREFREFSGLTPSDLQTARFPDLPGIPASALLGR